MFLFIGTIFLTGCEKQNVIDDKMIQENNQLQTQQQDQQQEKVSPEEVIDFEHPGNDEAGKKIQEMDSLINSTSSGSYEEDLSGEILAEQE